MTDVYISWEDSVDPQACNSDPDRYYGLSRDPARTPYQWDASPNAGRYRQLAELEYSYLCLQLIVLYGCFPNVIIFFYLH